MSGMVPYYYKSVAHRPQSTLWGDDFFRNFFWGRDAWSDAFRVDVRDKGDHFLIEAELPGVSREQVHVDVEDDVLTISCDMGSCERDEKESYLYSERRCGHLQRSFTLSQVKEDEISAEYKDGVLKLTLPKEQPEEKKNARRIDVR